MENSEQSANADGLLPGAQFQDHQDQSSGVENDEFHAARLPAITYETFHGQLPGVDHVQGGNLAGVNHPGQSSPSNASASNGHLSNSHLPTTIPTHNDRQPYPASPTPLPHHNHQNFQVPGHLLDGLDFSVHLANAEFQGDARERAREEAAIRNLLDVPNVDIPIWEREKESPALTKKLMPHQRVGLTWLIKQEQSPHKGGILADDMGLGKTIQALALILARPPNDGTRKTTLIVVPTSLLHQWKQEIVDKIKPGYQLKTVVFHSQKKRNMTVSKLLSYDIVLTTYGTIAHEWKNVHERRKLQAGILLASHAVFHRVILDEAHNIKNRKALASKGVDCLHATYRLCMTGTPLMNRLDELYPLVRFLRIEPYRHYECFKVILNSAKGGESTSMRQLQVLLGRILLRRTEKTIVDGQPIFTLPELTVHTINAVFDKDQGDYYKSLETRSALQMNRYLKEGTVTRNYMAVLLLILRLRQCCCHPHLIKNHAVPEGVDMTVEDMVKLAFKLPKQAIARIKQQQSFLCPMCHQYDEKPVLIYPCGHHVCGNCVTNMVLAGAASPGEAEDDDIGELIGHCPTDGCSQSVDSKHLICYSRFAEVHLHNDSGDDDMDDSDDEDAEEGDSDEGSLKDFVVSDDHESSDDEDEELDTPMYSDDESGSEHGPDSNHPKIKDSGESQCSELEPGAQSEPSLPAGKDDDDDSDDSLPTVEVFVASLKNKAKSSGAKSKAAAGVSSTMRNGKNGAKPSKRKRRMESSDSDDDQKHMAGSRGQKGRAGKCLARPQKRVKREKSKPPGKLTLGAIKKSSLSSAAAKQKYLKVLRKNWETSAKIEKAMELLAMIQSEFPNEKTLVFSQFTSFLDLIEIPISNNGYNHRRYDGSMSPRERDSAVEDFMTKPEVKIMLLSLRCGNAGLNLYSATRVVMLDPFWNPSLEDQAIKRAHRLGQTKPVIAYRILVAETIEDRIIKLQEEKKVLVNAVLDPEARKGVSRLTTSQLAGLFGITWNE